MMGYADEYETIVLELTYNYGVTEYTKGNAYAQVRYVFVAKSLEDLSTLELYLYIIFIYLPCLYDECKISLQIAISTDDVYKSGEVVNHVTQELGGKITRQAGPIPGINTKIVAFLDPDGWKTVSPQLNLVFYMHETKSGQIA